MLVNICREVDVEQMCARAGLPPLTVPGGGKRGIWHLNADGSGTWTRLDKSATRLKTLWASGPRASEVTMRLTYDVDTDVCIDVTYEFASLKDKNAEIDPPARSLRTVFYFDKTTVQIPPDALPSKAPEGVSDSVPLKAETVRPSAGSTQRGGHREATPQTADGPLSQQGRGKGRRGPSSYVLGC